MRLINGDCLEAMDNLIEEGVEVDLILVDPPYGTIKGLGIDGYKNRDNSWDVSIPPREIYDKSVKLLRDGGVLILFSQEPYTSLLRTNTLASLKFNYPLIWEKDHFANGLISKKAPVNYFEDINVLTKIHDTTLKHPLRDYARRVMEYIGLSLKEINNKLKHRRAEHFFYWDTTQFGLLTSNTYNELIDIFNIDNMEGYMSYDNLKEVDTRYKYNHKRVFNLWEGGKTKSNILKYKKDYDRHHPTQKPTALLEDIIKTYSNDGDLVLDFTMGSGSTGVAAVNTNRDFIGIELDETYFNIAKKRIEEANICK